MSTETGPCDQSTLATDESIKVGICSEGTAIAESLPQAIGNITTNRVGAMSEDEPVDCENRPDYRAGSETIIRDDNSQAFVDTALGAKESTETSTEKPIEGNNVEELRTSNTIEIASESVQQSNGNCCANKDDGTESGVRIIEDKKIIKIGEVQENASMHGHFSNVSSCKAFPGSNFDMGSNIECSVLYDEKTAFFGTLAAKPASSMES